jgi:hypothetical protein
MNFVDGIWLETSIPLGTVRSLQQVSCIAELGLGRSQISYYVGKAVPPSALDGLESYQQSSETLRGLVSVLETHLCQPLICLSGNMQSFSTHTVTLPLL